LIKVYIIVVIKNLKIILRV